MEITSVGNNTVTACINPDCDQVLSVKRSVGNGGLDSLNALVDQHLDDHPECKAYVDSRPSLIEAAEAFRESMHDHDCVAGPCKCVCGCAAAMSCVLVFSGLCSSCYLDSVRDGDCEAKPEIRPSPSA